MNISSKVNKKMKLLFKQTLIQFKAIFNRKSKDKSMASAAGFHAKTNGFSVNKRGNIRQTQDNHLRPCTGYLVLMFSYRHYLTSRYFCTFPFSSSFTV